MQATTQYTEQLHDDLFVKIHDGRFIVWDFRNHKQFEVTLDELSRLRHLSKPGAFDAHADAAFAEAGLTGPTTDRTPWGWDFLSRIFHVGTSHPGDPVSGEADERNAMQYAKDYVAFCNSIRPSAPEIEVVHGGVQAALPTPNLQALNDASLWNTLVARRTCRDFYQRPVALDTLSTLLYAAFGEMKSADEPPIGMQRFGFCRTSPSSGGLQSVEAYVWARRVGGLDPGVYHYMPRRHSLETVQTPLPDEHVSTYLCNQHWSNDLPFVVVLTGRFDKMWWKYPHSRAYRPLLMEVGTFTQTFCLCVTALGLNPWMTGYFLDSPLNEALRLDVTKEQALFVVGAGYGSGSPYTREVRTIAARLAGGEAA